MFVFNLSQFNNENTILNNIEFENSIFEKVFITSSNLSENSFSNIKFINCDFSNTSFENTSFVRCEFVNCKIQEIDHVNKFSRNVIIPEKNNENLDISLHTFVRLILNHL